MLLLTCEHATQRVPPFVAPLLPAGLGTRTDHAALDRGAAWLARRLGTALDAPVILGRVGRLAVDLNREASNPGAWSRYARRLPDEVRQRLVERHHGPHRARVTDAVADGLASAGAVVHVAVHSFAPRLRGQVRSMDIGLLYDPARPGERALAARWKSALEKQDPRLRVRRNAPYRGVTDGLTRHLRRRFPDPTYCGLELEVNQRWCRGGRFEASVAAAIVASLRDVMTV